MKGREKMKKILATILAAALTLGTTGCGLYTARMLNNDDLLRATEEKGMHFTGQSQFQKPPKGTLSTPDGEVTLTPAGYSWTAQGSDGTATCVIADQADRPPDQDALKPVKVSYEHAETVYATAPGSDASAPTNSLGYLMTPQWEAAPSSVTYTCWPETIWKNSSVRQEEVVTREAFSFYAKPGGYIYELTATWDDTGVGYYGSANYYVYIVSIPKCSHQVAAQAQTVADPITGYCGNTQTTLYIADKEYSFMYDYSVALTDLLVNLDYDPDRVCRCMPQYRADTEFGSNYHIHLEQGFVRCDKGQADLTQAQIDTIAEIIEWAETTNCKYPLDD